MVTEETIQKLYQLKLNEIAAGLRELAHTCPDGKLSTEEAIGLLVDREWQHRENKRTQRRLKDAKLPTQACLEDVESDPARGLDKAMVRSFGSGNWIVAKHNVIIEGATGVGKSYLGTALAQAACRMGYRALSVRVPRLLHQLGISKADGTYASNLEKLAKIDVLLLDDFLLAPMEQVECRDVLEILEDRYAKHSTIITSQLPPKTWHSAMKDPTIADAICDRLLHNASIISLRGESIRKRRGLKTETGQKGTTT